MPLYYLHLRDGTDETLDDEGREFADSDALREFVLTSARDILSSDIKNGLMDLRFRIDAEDEAGQVVYTLPFKHAVSIIPGD
jgi:hypothetical protein